MLKPKTRSLVTLSLVLLLAGAGIPGTALASPHAASHNTRIIIVDRDAHFRGHHRHERHGHFDRHRHRPIERLLHERHRFGLRHHHDHFRGFAGSRHEYRGGLGEHRSGHRGGKDFRRHRH